MYDDLRGRRDAAERAWRREGLSAVIGDVELGRRDAVEDRVIPLVRSDLRIRGQCRDSCERVGVLANKHALARCRPP